MKYLQRIGESKMRQWLKENYSIEAREMIPVQQGVIGENYVVVTSNQQKYFLKIYLQSKLQIDNPEGLENTLNLTWKLHNLGINQIVYPIKTKEGSLVGKLGEYVIILSNYIDGTNPEVTPEVVAKVAKLLAEIHQVNTQDINLPIEPFDTTYAEKLNEQLEILETSEKFTSVKNLLLPHKSRLTKHLSELEEFCSKAKGKKEKLAITHGDLIADNLLVNGSGDIFIVDWVTARLAFPERDIWFFLNSHAKVFLKSYKEASPQENIDSDIISFFMYKRYLEDIVWWVEEILSGRLSEEQIQKNVEGIKISCLDAFENIEEKIEKIHNLISGTIF